jgi:hypothetical protein
MMALLTDLLNSENAGAAPQRGLLGANVPSGLNPADALYRSGFAPPREDQQRLDVAKRNAQSQYPGLAPTLDDIDVMYGTGDGRPGGQLEYYPAGEAFNPNPGRNTIEVQNRNLRGQWLSEALAGDALHELKHGDQKFSKMRRDFVRNWSERQKDFAVRKFNELRDQGKENRTFEEFMEQTWIDAVIRGYVAPDERDEWRKQGNYSEEERTRLDAMKQYIREAPLTGSAGRTVGVPGSGRVGLQYNRQF